MIILPLSEVHLTPEELREEIRRHHWRRYFAAVRSGNSEQASYHGRLARSCERRDQALERRAAV